MRLIFLYSLLLLVAAVVPVRATAIGSAGNEPQPVSPLCHAHNDFQHDRPLFDALQYGFDSVEVDVVLARDTLFVAHEDDEIQSGRTLRSLYLDPLLTLDESGGLPATFFLLIDIKTEAETTWAVLRPELERYAQLWVQWDHGHWCGGQIMILLSGNRPVDAVSAETRRLAFLDGRLEDLERGVSAELYPWISIDWSDHFRWRGDGEMNLAEEKSLQEMVARVHAAGQLVRFWDTDHSYRPYRRNLWSKLKAAGTDVINTDDLAGLGRKTATKVDAK